MVGKAWWQEREAAAPTASMAREQRDECWFASCFFLLVMPGPQHKMVPPDIRMDLLTLTN